MYKPPKTGAEVPAELRSKYPPLLDRTIKRILSETPPPAGAQAWLGTVMRMSQHYLHVGGLTRRMVEVHVLRYLMCKEELKAEVPHG